MLRLSITRTPVDLPGALTLTMDLRARLHTTGLPFVFFTDAETDRGCVLYHRYDGHYG